jgi:hypothetical protein
MTLKEYRPNGVTWGRNGSLSRTEKQGWRPLPGRAGLAPRSIFAANYARILTATDKRFFLSLINATEPATETALPRPATAERNTRGEGARALHPNRRGLKAEAGITPAEGPSSLRRI